MNKKKEKEKEKVKGAVGKMQTYRVNYEFPDLPTLTHDLIGDITGATSTLVTKVMGEPAAGFRTQFEIKVADKLQINLDFRVIPVEKSFGRRLTLNVQAFVIKDGSSSLLVNYEPAAYTNLGFDKDITLNLVNPYGPGEESKPAHYPGHGNEFLKWYVNPGLFAGENQRYLKSLVRVTYLNILMLVLQQAGLYQRYNPLISDQVLEEVSFRLNLSMPDEVYAFFPSAEICYFDPKAPGKPNLSTKAFRLLFKDTGPSHKAVIQCYLSCGIVRKERPTSYKEKIYTNLSIAVSCNTSTKVFPGQDPHTVSLMNPLLGPFQEPNFVQDSNLYFHGCKHPGSYVIQPVSASEESYIPDVLTRGYSRAHILLLVSLADFFQSDYLMVKDMSTLGDCGLHLGYIRLALNKPPLLDSLNFKIPNEEHEARVLLEKIGRSIRSNKDMVMYAEKLLSDDPTTRREFCRLFTAKLDELVSEPMQHSFENMTYLRVRHAGESKKYMREASEHVDPLP